MYGVTLRVAPMYSSAARSLLRGWGALSLAAVALVWSGATPGVAQVPLPPATVEAPKTAKAPKKAAPKQKASAPATEAAKSASPAANVRSPVSSSPLRWTADDEVATVRDHAGEHCLAEQPRARRDYDLGNARTTSQQRVGDALEPVVLGRASAGGC